MVGIDRETKLLSISVENYCRKIMGIIKASLLSNDLKVAVMSRVDIIDYKGLSVIRIFVPRQKNISYSGDDVYIRQYNNTIKVESAKDILAVNSLFIK